MSNETFWCGIETLARQLAGASASSRRALIAQFVAQSEPPEEADTAESFRRSVVLRLLHTWPIEPAGDRMQQMGVRQRSTTEDRS